MRLKSKSIYLPLADLFLTQSFASAGEIVLGDFRSSSAFAILRRVRNSRARGSILLLFDKLLVRSDLASSVAGLVSRAVG